MANLRFAGLERQQIARVVEIDTQSNGAPWSEQAFANELDNPNSYFRVALLDGKVVGFGGYWRCVDVAHITTVAIAEEHRRNGYGRLLMLHLLKSAQADGMVGCTLEVRAGNEPAILMYENLGFVHVSTRKAYYPDNREDAVIMWLYELGKWSG